MLRQDSVQFLQYGWVRCGLVGDISHCRHKEGLLDENEIYFILVSFVKTITLGIAEECIERIELLSILRWIYLV